MIMIKWIDMRIKFRKSELNLEIRILKDYLKIEF